MFCPRCGKENVEGSKFCIYCGAELLREGLDDRVKEKRMRRIVFVVIVVIGILMVLGIGGWFYLKFSKPVLFPVKIGKKWGYINKEGKVVFLIKD